MSTAIIRSTETRLSYAIKIYEVKRIVEAQEDVCTEDLKLEMQDKQMLII